MKKIIFILALFVSFVANAQYTAPTGYTNINSRYDWLAGVFRALGLPAGGNAAFTTGQAQKAGAVYYDSTGVDSGLYVWSGLAWRSYEPYTDADARAAISLTTTGTSGAATYNSATGVFNIPVYAGTLNANVGAFYRWLKPATQEIKTFANGYGILIDSTTNTDALTAILDSATVFPHIRATIAPNLLFDSLGAAGISPITTWNNTLYGRRISISGGSIDTTASGGLLITVAGGGITSLNGLTGATQTFATGTTGTAPNIASSGTTHTFNFPNAGAGISQGMISNGTQTIAGNKIFSGVTEVTGGLTTTTTGFNGNLFVMGGTTATRTGTVTEYIIGGASGTGFRVGIRGSTNYTVNENDAFADLNIGATTVTEYVTATTHPVMTRANIKPLTITNGTATTTDASTLRIEGPPTGTAVITNPVSSLWVDAGVSRFDEGVLLGAGTTAIWPLKFTSGTNLTTAVAGVFEYDGSNFFATATAANRRQMVRSNVATPSNGFLPIGNGTDFTLAAITEGQNINVTNGAGSITVAGPTLTKSPTIETPGASENIWSWKVPVAITITDVHAVLVGSSTPSVTYNIKFDTDRSAAGTSVYTSNQTVTSTTTGTSASGVNDNTIPAGSIVWIITSAQSGTVNQLGLTITYTED